MLPPPLWPVLTPYFRTHPSSPSWVSHAPATSFSFICGVQIPKFLFCSFLHPPIVIVTYVYSHKHPVLKHPLYTTSFSLGRKTKFNTRKKNKYIYIVLGFYTEQRRMAWVFKSHFKRVQTRQLLIWSVTLPAYPAETVSMSVTTNNEDWDIGHYYGHKRCFKTVLPS